MFSLVFQVSFYLLIPEKVSVCEVNIKFGNHELYPFCPVSKENKKIWYCSIIFHKDPIKFPKNSRYLYQIHLDISHDTTQSGPETAASICSEKDVRKVKRLYQFDVFKFPDRRFQEGETIPNSVIFYLTWFLQHVKASTLPEMLTKINNLDIKSLSQEHVQELVGSILNYASETTTTDIQRLYLCMVLSNLKDARKKLDLKGDKLACDRLLHCLSVDFKRHSIPDVTLLAEIAIILVENCSSPGRLTLAAYFYPYFGIKFLLDKKKDAKHLTHTYETEEYQKMVAMLFSCLKVENRDGHKKLLRWVLRSAQTSIDALNLCSRPELSELFESDDEKVDFFVKFFIKAQSKTGKSLQAKLWEFHCMPSKIREKILRPLHSSLLEYIKSEDELRDEKDTDFVLKLFFSIMDQDKDQFIGLLFQLSESRSIFNQNLLLKILQNKNLEKDWHNIPDEKRAKICGGWVITRVRNIASKSNSLDGLSRVIAIYESIDAIMKCSPNVIPLTLAQKVLMHVEREISPNTEPCDVLLAFSQIDNCLPVVQECYISHVRKILCKQFIEDSRELLKKFAGSRYVFNF